MTEYGASLQDSSPLRDVVAWARTWWWLVGWWAGGRVVVFVTSIVVATVGPVGYLRSELARGPLSLLGSWDGLWYQRVASAGYLLVPGRQSDPAFFPLYPLLLRASHSLGLGYAIAGIIVSNVAFLVALVGFHELTREFLGRDLARRATRYLAVFPLSYVFSMVYPESLVLALSVFAVVAARRGNWLVAALFAGSAALARPEALLVAVPLLGVAVHQYRTLTPARRGLAFGGVLAPLAGLVAYLLYLARVLHDPLAWSHAEQTWGRRFTPLGFVHAIASVPTQAAQNPAVVRDLVAVVVYLVLLAVAFKAGAPAAWLIAGTGVVVLPLFSGTVESIGRFGLLAPPIFWGLAAIGRGPGLDRTIVAVSTVLLAAATATVPYMFP